VRVSHRARLGRSEHANALFLACVVLSASGGCSGEPQEHSVTRGEAVERRIVATRWDTVFQIGSPDPADTLLLGPRTIELWGDRVAVIDWASLVKVFDRSGRLLWWIGREGRGPKEFNNLVDLEIAPSGNLWALDAGNVRLAEISPDGEYVREVPLTHLRVPPSNVLRLSDRVIFVANTPLSTFTAAHPDSFRILSISAIPWELPTSWPGVPNAEINLRLVVTARDPDRTGWAAALYHGPGFMVWSRDTVRTYRYIDPIPFAVKASPRINALRADSARYGAVSIAATNDEIFMLFGGRPRRFAHPDEPTVLIDVYGLDGVYRRSYRLPFDTRMMTTDGETFYVIEEAGYPSILALRPRGKH